MTITTRSNRDTSLVSRHTNVQVGPGTYHTENLNHIRRHVAPFCTSSQRHDFVSSSTPGPGAHDIILPSKSNHTRQSSSTHTPRSSTSCRIGPVAPGSSVYRESTIIDNPGPGAYDPILPRKQRLLGHAPDHHHHTIIVTEQPSSVPAIPQRHQCHGYSRQRDGSYQPNQAPVVHVPVRRNNMTKPRSSQNKSKNKRAILRGEPNLNHPTTPGPGDYDPHLEMKNKPSTKNGLRWKRLEKSSGNQQPSGDDEKQQTSSPGPGSYFQEPTPAKNRGKHPFISSTRRFRPGSAAAAAVAERRPSEPQATEYYPRVALHQSKRRFITRKGSAIGFTTTTPRQCCVSPKSPEYPPRKASLRSPQRRPFSGNPQSYTYSRSNVQIRRKVVTRESNSWISPGPGAYESDISTEARPRPASACSVLRRRNLHTRQPTTPTPILRVQRFQEDRADMKKKINRRNKPQVSFGSHSSRIDTVFQSQDLPGPGAYDPTTDTPRPSRNQTRSQELRHTVDHAPRFHRMYRADNPRIGPGAYTLPKTLEQKSHNISYSSSLI